MILSTKLFSWRYKMNMTGSNHQLDQVSNVISITRTDSEIPHHASFSVSIGNVNIPTVACTQCTSCNRWFRHSEFKTHTQSCHKEGKCIHSGNRNEESSLPSFGPSVRQDTGTTYVKCRFCLQLFSESMFQQLINHERSCKERCVSEITEKSSGQIMQKISNPSAGDHKSKSQVVEYMSEYLRDMGDKNTNNLLSPASKRGQKLHIDGNHGEQNKPSQTGPLKRPVYTQTLSVRADVERNPQTNKVIVRLFQCPQCAAVFPSKEDCLQHKRKMHLKRSHDSFAMTKQNDSNIVPKKKLVRIVKTKPMDNKTGISPLGPEDQSKKTDHPPVSNKEPGSHNPNYCRKMLGQDSFKRESTVQTIKRITTENEEQETAFVIAPIEPEHTVTSVFPGFLQNKSDSGFKEECLSHPKTVTFLSDQVSGGRNITESVENYGGCENQQKPQDEIPLFSREEDKHPLKHDINNPTQDHAAAQPILIEPMDDSTCTDERKEKDCPAIKCAICCKLYTTKQELTTHMRKHLKDFRAQNISLHKKILNPSQMERLMSLEEECSSRTETIIADSTDATEQTSEIQCTFCNEKYRDILDYTNHLKVHSRECGKEKPVLTSIDKLCAIVDKNVARSGHCFIPGPSSPGYRPLPQYPCRYCGIKCKSFLGLRSHMKVHSSLVGKAVSESPGASLKHHLSFKDSKKGWMEMEIMGETTTQSFTCSICAGQFKSLISLQTHIQSNHANYYKQSIAGKQKSNKLNIFQKESRNNAQYKFLSCGVCPMKFSDRLGLERHKCSLPANPAEQKIHGNSRKKLKCLFCERKFRTPIELVMHKKSHKNVFSLTCLLCKRTFGTHIELVMHKRRHRHVFSCLDCSATFITEKGLKAHRFSHHQSKHYRCKICLKTFTTVYRIMNHHCTGRQFLCVECGKIFSSRAMLKSHKFNHSQLKCTCKCIICNRMFTSIKEWKGHQQKEHPEQYVKCGLCPALFTSHEMLNQHLDETHNEHPALFVQCGLCPRFFTSDEKMIQHLKTDHSEKHKVLSDEDMISVGDDVTSSPTKDMDETLIGENRSEPQDTVPIQPGISTDGQAVTILEAFQKIMTPEIVSIIRRNTNKQAKLKFHPFTDNEILAAFGLLILAGLYHEELKGYSMAKMWDHKCICPFFVATMSLCRFQQFLQLVRFDDRTTSPRREAHDCLAPIRQVWELFVGNLRKCYIPSHNITIGAQFLPFQGKCKFLISKSSDISKHGIKIWWACDASTGYPLNGQVYLGQQPVRMARVVHNMVSPYYYTDRNVTGNSSITSVPLAEGLLKKGLTYVGAIGKSKSQIPPQMKDSKDRELKSSIYVFTDNITLVSYVSEPGKTVTLLSTKHHKAQVSDQPEKKPVIMEDYDETKGSVDKLVEMVNKFTCTRETNSWPLALFFNMLDVAGVAAQVIWTCNFPNWENNPRGRIQKDRRKIFLAVLAEALVGPHIQTRLSEPKKLPCPAIVALVKLGYLDKVPVPSVDRLYRLSENRVFKDCLFS